MTRHGERLSKGDNEQHRPQAWPVYLMVGGLPGVQEEGQIEGSFLRGMADLSQSPQQVAVWPKLLQEALRATGATRFIDPLPTWNSRLLVLDLLSSVPQLQYCLVLPPPGFSPARHCTGLGAVPAHQAGDLGIAVTRQCSLAGWSAWQLHWGCMT